MPTCSSSVGLPDGVWLYEDLGYKNGLFASPKVLGELIFPYYKEMVDFFHSYDLPVVLHTCGSTAQALPLIVEAGFDALNPMERKAKDNDPFVFAEKYGDQLAFVGGLDARVFETQRQGHHPPRGDGLHRGHEGARGARWSSPRITRSRPTRATRATGTRCRCTAST